MLPVWLVAPDTCPVPKWRNWQTRVVQVHVLAREWGFESLLRHQKQFKKASLRRGFLRLGFAPGLRQLMGFSAVARCVRQAQVEFRGGGFHGEISALNAQALYQTAQLFRTLAEDYHE